MITIIEHKNHFELKVQWSPKFKTHIEKIKEVPGVKYIGESKVWIAPIASRFQTECLKASCNAKQIVAAQAQPEQLGIIPPLPELTVKPGLKNITLRHYQEQGIAQMVKLKRCINGDDPGLGKTVQSIGSMVMINEFPAVVICPATLKLNWANEIRKYSHLRCMVLDDKVKGSWMRYYESGLVDVFIVNFESLKKYFVTKMPTTKRWTSDKIELRPDWSKIKTIVIDESHRLKDPTTIQTKLCLRLCTGKDNVFLLTGTPVVNRPVDLFPQLAIMGHLQFFGGKKAYLDRYCEGGQGSNNLKELNYLLNRVCFFKRNKTDVLKELPEKQRQTLLTEISTRDEYDFAFNEFRRWLEMSGCDDKEIAKKLRGEILVKMNVLRQISARGKMKAAFEHINEITGSGQKVVVFATLKEIIRGVKEHYPHAVEIHGDISEANRAANIYKFQNDPGCNVIICNIKAAGVGITLTASSNVLFIEYPWTWADCIQCEDRTHRIGQKESVTITYLFGSGTIDERLFEIIKEKKEIGNTISGAQDQTSEQTIDKIIDLFK